MDTILLESWIKQNFIFLCKHVYFELYFLLFIQVTSFSIYIIRLSILAYQYTLHFSWKKDVLEGLCYSKEWNSDQAEINEGSVPVTHAANADQWHISIELYHSAET